MTAAAATTAEGSGAAAGVAGEDVLNWRSSEVTTVEEGVKAGRGDAGAADAGSADAGVGDTITTATGIIGFPSENANAHRRKWGFSANPHRAPISVASTVNLPWDVGASQGFGPVAEGTADLRLFVGRLVTPGCQIGYMDHTGCHQLNRV